MALDQELRDVKEKAFGLIASIFAPFCTPTQYTLIGFAFGVACVAACAAGHYWWATALWWINRFFDGLDGVVARYTKQQTDLGGYVDIICDFTVYAVLPIGLVHSVWTTHHGPQMYPYVWYALSFMEATFFVNAASLFMLSAVVEKMTARGNHQKPQSRMRSRSRSRGKGPTSQPRGKGITTVAMPRGLIEGAETMVFYQLFISMPNYLTELMALFAIAVSLNVVIRMVSAVRMLR
jgi:phosphatidylglycerophosphate synthase